MKIKAAILCMAIFLCCQSFHSPSFEITSQRLKVQFDPVTQKLAVTDTIGITFYKNVDSISFLLQDTMQVERVGIANQDLEFEQLTEFDCQKIAKNSEWQEWKDKKLVRVSIPKSLYPEQIEVWYSGEYQKIEPGDDFYWHPVQPDALTTFSVTALCPRDFEFEFDAEQTFFAENEIWRISRWQHTKPAEFLTFSVNSLSIDS